MAGHKQQHSTNNSSASVEHKKLKQEATSFYCGHSCATKSKLQDGHPPRRYSFKPALASCFSRPRQPRNRTGARGAVWEWQADRHPPYYGTSCTCILHTHTYFLTCLLFLPKIVNLSEASCRCPAPIFLGGLCHHRCLRRSRFCFHFMIVRHGGLSGHYAITSGPPDLQNTCSPFCRPDGQHGKSFNQQPVRQIDGLLLRNYSSSERGHHAVPHTQLLARTH